MKKLILSVVLSLLSLGGILFLLSYQRTPKDISLKAFSEDFSAAYVKAEGTLECADTLAIKKNFGLTAEDYAEMVYVLDSDMMSAQEMLIVKLNTEEQRKPVKDAMEERLSTRKEAFDGYGSDQMEILNRAIVYSAGNYVCLIVSEKDREWLDLFKLWIWE